MPKLPKIRWKTLPAGPRWLVYGVLLLVGILAGGAVTAYGGMLLVVLLWAIWMGGRCLLLQFTWRTAFPGQGLRDDPAFLVSWAVGSAGGVAVIAALVLYRNTVYHDDAIN